MSIATLINRPCTIIRRSASQSTNPYGDKVKSEASSVAVWELQPRDSQEGEDELAKDTERAFFLSSVALHSGDAVIDGVTGETYEIEGEPMRRRNPRTQAFEHVEAVVKRTVGPADQVGS